MLNPFRAMRRKKLLEGPFPPEWEEIVAKNVAHDRFLDEDAKAHLRDLIRIFIAEKEWEGLSGLELTDEIRVTIA
ncbi:MAG: zinc-dependent peptidase, partial [Sandaracinaceae bacterium]